VIWMFTFSSVEKNQKHTKTEPVKLMFSSFHIITVTIRSN
jgi:hypothetical protein